MIWSDSYIGLPYTALGRSRETGVDCWGLAKVIYQEELGIMLPSYLGYTSIEEHAELAAVISGATGSPIWIPAGELPAPFDICVFRRGHLETHVGIFVRDGLMIHIARDDCAKIETIRSGVWAHRLTGIYRHVEMASKAL